MIIGIRLKKSEYVLDVYMSALEEQIAPIEYRLLNGGTLNFEEYRYSVGRREAYIHALEIIKELTKKDN